MFTIHHTDIEQGKIIIQLNTMKDGTPLSTPVHLQTMLPIVNGQYLVGLALLQHLEDNVFTPVWDRLQASASITNSDALLEFVASHSAPPAPLSEQGAEK